MGRQVSAVGEAATQATGSQQKQELATVRGGVEIIRELHFHGHLYTRIRGDQCSLLCFSSYLYVVIYTSLLMFPINFFFFLFHRNTLLLSQTPNPKPQTLDLKNLESQTLKPETLTLDPRLHPANPKPRTPNL